MDEYPKNAKILAYSCIFCSNCGRMCFGEATNKIAMAIKQDYEDGRNSLFELMGKHAYRQGLVGVSVISLFVFLCLSVCLCVRMHMPLSFSTQSRCLCESAIRPTIAT